MTSERAAEGAGRPEHPDNEHRWQWGTDHGDGTGSHGPCVVEGCAEPGQTRVSYLCDFPLMDGRSCTGIVGHDGVHA